MLNKSYKTKIHIYLSVILIILSITKTSHALQCAFFPSRTYEQVMLHINDSSVIVRGKVISQPEVSNSGKEKSYQFEVYEYLTNEKPQKIWKVYATPEPGFLFEDIKANDNLTKNESTMEFSLSKKHDNALNTNYCSRFNHSDTGFPYLNKNTIYDATLMSQKKARDWYKWKEIIAENKEHFILKHYSEKHIMYESFPVDQNYNQLFDKEKSNLRQIKEYDLDSKICSSTIYNTNTFEIIKKEVFQEVCTS